MYTFSSWFSVLYIILLWLCLIRSVHLNLALSFRLVWILFNFTITNSNYSLLFLHFCVYLQIYFQCTSIQVRNWTKLCINWITVQVTVEYLMFLVVSVWYLKPTPAWKVKLSLGSGWNLRARVWVRKRVQIGAIAGLTEEVNERQMNRGSVCPTLKLGTVLRLPPAHTEASVITTWQTYCTLLLFLHQHLSLVSAHE